MKPTDSEKWSYSIQGGLLFVIFVYVYLFMKKHVPDVVSLVLSAVMYTILIKMMMDKNSESMRLER